LFSRWRIDQENNEVCGLLLRKAEADLEGPLLAIWPLEGDHVLQIRPELVHILQPKAYGLNISILPIEIDRREIIWLSFTSFILEQPLQPENFATIICTHEVVKFRRHHGLYTNRFTKPLGHLCKPHIHSEISANWAQLPHHAWRGRHRGSVQIGICG
jgi:hypothetical protein